MFCDGDRHQDHVHVYFEGLGVGLERRIHVRLFRSRWLDAGLDVYVLGQILGEKREGAANSNRQENCEGDSSGEPFAVHRPYPRSVRIHAMEGGDPRPKSRATSTLLSGIVAQSRKRFVTFWTC